MVNDNSASKRQQRRAEYKLARREKNQLPRDRVLIVCEGEKTEVHYFEEMRKELRVSSAKITVLHSAYGTEPKNVAEYAEYLFLYGDTHKGITSKAFDIVYAVFDRDEHPYYHEALKKMDILGKKYKNDKKDNVFHAIPSVPCFELWVLLHFQNVFSALSRHEVFRCLKKICPLYDKSSLTLYKDTKNNLPNAIARAKILNAKTTPHDGTEPYTAVVDVVEKLQEQVRNSHAPPV